MPPLLFRMNEEPKNWARLYIAVIATLALDIALFYWFTKAFQ